MFGGSEITSGQAVIKMLKLRCDLEFEHSNLIFPQDSWANDDVPTKFGC